MREQKSGNRIDEKRKKKNDELMMKNDEVNEKNIYSVLPIILIF